MKVEFYNGTTRWLVPTEEAAHRFLISEFNRLAKPLHPAEYSDFVDKDPAGDGSLTPEFMLDDFAPWIESVWEWSTFAVHHIGNWDEDIKTLARLFDSMLIDTDGELDGFSEVEDWNPTEDSTYKGEWDGLVTS